MFEFRLDFQALVGHYVESKKDRNTLFYELVIKNGSSVIARIPFNHVFHDFHVKVYDFKDKIPFENINYQYCFRSVTKLDKVEFFINKVVYLEKDDYEQIQVPKCLEQLYDPNEYDSITKIMNLININNHKIGYIRHLIEDQEEIYEKKLLSWSYGSKVNTNYFSLFRYKPIMQQTDFKTKFYIGQPPNKKKYYWVLNRDFYSLSNVTINNMEQQRIYTLIIKLIYNSYKVKNANTSANANDFIVYFHKILSEDIVYRSDFEFTNTTKVTDHNDTSILTSVAGDCEDMTHYYLRCFYVLFTTYKLQLQSNDKLYHIIEFIEKNYKPQALICQILLKTGLDVHCTVILMPLTNQVTPQIFESTNPYVTDVYFESPGSKAYRKYKAFHLLIDRFYLREIEQQYENWSVHKMKQDMIKYKIF